MTTVLGRYELQGKLGSGGMAEVWLARAVGPSGFAKTVVVKRVLPNLSDDSTVDELFRTEARLAARLDHPNLLHVFDFGQEPNGALVLVMELVDGASLRAVVAELRKGKQLDVRIAAKLMALVCEGLHAAHELKDDAGQPLNLVHRDISPENLLLARSGAVKVADFGIARIERHVQLTAPDSFRGKIGYASPEQILGETVTRAADVWACGVTLFELLTSQRPFTSETEAELAAATMHREARLVRQLRPDCPAELEAIVARCLEKDPKQRTPSAQALSEALEHFLATSGKPVRTADLGAVLDQLGIVPHQVTSEGTPFAEAEAVTRQAFFETNEFRARAELAVDGSLHELEPAPPPSEAALAHRFTELPDDAPLTLGESPSARSARYAKLELEAKPEPAATLLPEIERSSWATRLKRAAAVVVLALLTVAAITLVRRFAASAGPPGALFIDSSPSGAQVVVNGNPVGVTPWAGDNPPLGVTTVALKLPGFHEVIVRFDGGVDWSGTVPLKKAK